MTPTVYDIIGIGIGPFNLGLAALADSIPNLNCLFIDQNKEFNWHPGMMLDNARLQVPFYADLVTLADPCSRFSFLAFLKAKGRMFRFAILENNFLTRCEFNEYCKWVVSQLQNLRFGFRCEAVHFDEAEGYYKVYARDTSSLMATVFYCKNLVIGVGTEPQVPSFAFDHLTPKPSSAAYLTPGPSSRISGTGSLGEGREKPLVFHSSDYLYFKERVLTKKSVAVIGSGQSAAEIFYDLLQHSNQLCNGISWFTRTERFMPMDYSKFALEMTSPDYIDHFYNLHVQVKKARLKTQNYLYKGINASLLQEIYSLLYHLSLSDGTDQIGLYPCSELKRLTPSSDGEMELTFHHVELDKEFGCSVDAVILATGYRQPKLKFLDPIEPYLKRNADKELMVNRNYSVDFSETVFVQNAELHTHGFNAPDLGMGPYRNGIILNTILGYEHFKIEEGITFQKFFPPPNPEPPSPDPQTP